MSNLVAIAYDDLNTANQVMTTLGELSREHNIDLEDAVVVERKENGKIKLHQPSTTATGAAGGALWGGLIGLIFLAPLFGLAIGAATGALAGSATDVGVDDNFMKELGAKLPENGAAVIVLVRSANRDKVGPAVSQYGGQLIQSSLSDEAEARFQAALDARGVPAG